MNEWQPIATCPKSRIVLLFAVTDRDRHTNAVTNWKMRTGSWHNGYDNDDYRRGNYSPWTWDGEQLRTWDHQPTHWIELPSPPSDQAECQHEFTLYDPVADRELCACGAGRSVGWHPLNAPPSDLRAALNDLDSQSAGNGTGAAYLEPESVAEVEHAYDLEALRSYQNPESK